VPDPEEKLCVLIRGEREARDTRLRVRIMGEVEVHNLCVCGSGERLPGLLANTNTNTPLKTLQVTSFPDIGAYRDQPLPTFGMLPNTHSNH